MCDVRCKDCGWEGQEWDTVYITGKTLCCPECKEPIFRAAEPVEAPSAPRKRSLEWRKVTAQEPQERLVVPAKLVRGVEVQMKRFNGFWWYQRAGKWHIANVSPQEWRYL